VNYVCPERHEGLDMTDEIERREYEIGVCRHCRQQVIRCHQIWRRGVVLSRAKVETLPKKCLNRYQQHSMERVWSVPHGVLIAINERPE